MKQRTIFTMQSLTSPGRRGSIRWPDAPRERERVQTLAASKRGLLVLSRLLGGERRKGASAKGASARPVNLRPYPDDGRVRLRVAKRPSMLVQTAIEG
jgi:hypothetical protein